MGFDIVSDLQDRAMIPFMKCAFLFGKTFGELHGFSMFEVCPFFCCFIVAILHPLSMGLLARVCTCCRYNITCYWGYEPFFICVCVCVVGFSVAWYTSGSQFDIVAFDWKI